MEKNKKNIEAKQNVTGSYKKKRVHHFYFVEIRTYVKFPKNLKPIIKYRMHLPADSFTNKNILYKYIILYKHIIYINTYFMNIYNI